MPKFGHLSTVRLKECDPRLQEICKEVIELYDFSILEGHRGETTQNRLFDEGKSQLKYPKSKHNSLPSMAIDIAPYPIDWKDTKEFAKLAGMMLYAASKLGYKIRWGGDWQSFVDMPHFQLEED